MNLYKKIVSVVLWSFLPMISFSQGQIISITVDPPTPTTADSVTVYVDLQFSSGGCSPDSQSHNTSGNNTSATSHHCLGMLTVICPYTDTFELGYLQAGVHQFDFILTSGGGPSPCTPGIVPDDQDVLSFTVTSAVGIAETFQNNLVQIFPNPFSSSVTVEIQSEYVNSNTSFVIIDALGREVFQLSSFNSNQILLSELDFSVGMYFYQLIQNDEVISSGKIVKE